MGLFNKFKGLFKKAENSVEEKEELKSYDEGLEKTRTYFKDKISILDIGTGSGCIAITLNKELDSNVTACDISKAALDVAKFNAKENTIQVNFIESNVFSNIHDKFDIIISNPPYIDKDERVMESVKKYEPHKALYASDEGLFFYKEILKKARTFLNNRFIIAFEIGWWQGNLIKNIAEEYFNDSKIMIEKDLAGKARYIFIIKDSE